MSALAFVLLCLAGYAFSIALKRKKQIDTLNKDLTEFRQIKDAQEQIVSLNGEIVRVKTIVSKRKADHEALEDSIRSAEQLLLRLENAAEMSQENNETLVEVGFYAPLYDFGTAAQYKEELDIIRDKQKQLVKIKDAIQKTIAWEVRGSGKAGEKMTDSIGKLMLRAFNGECDAIIAKVKFGNASTYAEKITASAQSINKLTETWGVHLSEGYVKLKVAELHLVYEYQEKLEQEREEQRRIKEQMKEEERALKEIEKARQDSEKEEARYSEALERARKEMEKSTGEATTALAEKIAELQRQLEEAHKRTERAISQAQLTKSGHVYVISNIGSFGENVFKIGMTRRLEPMERVKELGDASVPFEFDVHALIYSDNAPELENALHKVFDKRRVNRINERREFFRVTLEEIEQTVRTITDKATFTKAAIAREYRETQAILAKEAKPINGTVSKSLLHVESEAL